MQLVGARCELILKQEYWFRGELAEAVNALHVKLVGGPWYRVFFDCGVFFEREEDLQVIHSPSRSDRRAMSEVLLPFVLSEARRRKPCGTFIRGRRRAKSKDEGRNFVDPAHDAKPAQIGCLVLRLRPRRTANAAGKRLWRGLRSGRTVFRGRSAWSLHVLPGRTGVRGALKDRN